MSSQFYGCVNKVLLGQMSSNPVCNPNPFEQIQPLAKSAANASEPDSTYKENFYKNNFKTNQYITTHLGE